MTVRRIVVSVEPAPHGRAALETAAEIAERLGAELVGLFVEDVELLHLAGLPFAREIGFPSATTRSLDVAAMERSLRSLANEARRALAEIAGRAPLRWSFRVTRGSTLAELLAAAAEADVLVTRAPEAERTILRLGGGIPGVVLLLPEKGGRHPLTAICSAGAPPARLAPALAGLSRLFDERLEVLLLCEDVDAADRWERELHALLPELETGGAIRVIRVADAAALAKRIGRSRAPLRPPAARNGGRRNR